jgi:hypothetical protein
MFDLGKVNVGLGLRNLGPGLRQVGLRSSYGCLGLTYQALSGIRRGAGLLNVRLSCLDIGPGLGLARFRSLRSQCYVRLRQSVLALCVRELAFANSSFSS